MTRRELYFALLLALGLTSAAISSASAADLYWETPSAVGSLIGPNYFNFTGSVGGQSPTTGDVVNVGNQGVAMLSELGLVEFLKLRVGHSQQSPYNGPGTVTISDGATVNLTGGTADGTSATSNGSGAALWVGNNQNNSVLNIDGDGTVLTSNNGVVIGIANSNPGRTGTLNITNGGSLIVSAGQIKLGERASGTSALDTNAGVLNVDGTIQAPSMYVGMRNTTSAYNQTGGAVTLTGVIEVAPNNTGTSNASTFSISGGTFSTGGNFFLGRGASSGATATITGGAVNVTNRFLMGGQTATNIVTTHTGGQLNTTQDVRVGDATTGTTQYNLSGDGVINSTTGGHVGRQGDAKFIQTGGTANFNAVLNIGNRETATGPNSGLYKISAGTLNAGANTGGNGLTVATSGTGELRVVGEDGQINILGNLLVGNGANGVGTLAYEFETGDLLSMINVVNNATFAAGSKLVLDATLAAPTAASYDLLTAVDIIDNGLVFDLPGWTKEIVAGGNGEILRVIAPVGPTEDADFDNDGDVDGEDFLTWQQGLGGPALPANGNANGDGVIDGADLTVWRNQFGVTTPVAAIPEPAAVVMLASALGLLGALRSTARKS